MKNFLPLFLVVLNLLLAAQPAVASASAIFGPPKKTDTADVEVVKDSLGRDTPRGMLAGFLNAIGEGDYERAAGFMDLSSMSKNRAKTQGPVLAQGLQTLLTNGSSLQPTPLVSNDAGGKSDDGLPDDAERIGNLKAGRDSIDLIAERTKGDDSGNGRIWLISSQTVKAIPDLVKKATASRLDRILPESLIEQKLAGVPIGHWMTMLALIAMAYAASFIIVRLLVVTVRRIWKRKELQAGTAHVIDAFELPLSLYAAVWIFVISAQQIGVSIIAREYFSRLTIIVAWLALVLFLWKLIDIIAETSTRKLIEAGKYGALSGIQFFRRTAKFLFLAVVLFVSLDTIGVDVTAALAALGIGGLALAFGAQKTVENFIGSIMVIFDQPVRIGDFCKVGDIMGTIEDIGMRSTRIRTLERTLVTIPNGDFSSQRIDNFAHRDRFRLYLKLMVRLDATAEQLRFLLVEIKAMMIAHPRVESANCRLLGWTLDAFEFEVQGAVMTTNNDDFMEAREDVFLRILEIVSQSGAALAVQHTPVPPAPGMEDDAARNALRTAAEDKMRLLREKGDLPLPKFTPEKMAELKNTLAYPPQGSIGS